MDPGRHAHCAALATRTRISAADDGVALFIPEPQRIVQLGLGRGGADQVLLSPPAGRACDGGRDQRRGHRHRATLVRACRPTTTASKSCRRTHADYLGDRRRADGPTGCRSICTTLRRAVRCTTTSTFYRMCRRALRRPGVACFNLFGSRFDPSFSAICAAFDDRVLVLPAVDEGNRIVFALTGPRIDEPVSPARQGARASWKSPGVCRSGAGWRT